MGKLIYNIKEKTIYIDNPLFFFKNKNLFLKRIESDTNLPFYGFLLFYVISSYVGYKLYKLIKKLIEGNALNF